jgi:actin
MKCDADLRKDLCSAVVLAGGTSMLPGFADRINHELLKKFAGDASNSRIRIVPDLQGRERGYNSQRKHASWIGGSMFASLPTFSQIQITKQEWEDSHDSIVHRKCF